LVHPESDGAARPTSYPTLRELDTIENYIYSKKRLSLSDLVPPEKSDTKLVVAVFAYQYRIGARSANGKFASTALSRTGISRVGTTGCIYDTIRRSFWPVTTGTRGPIAVLPARYAAYLAEARNPGADDAILGEQPGDEDRSFLFPVHKLFDGDECLQRATIRLSFSERHRNEKLSKFHSGTGVLPVDGFDISQSPFVRDSEYGDDLVSLERSGSSVLVVPVWHLKLNRVAMAKNTKSGKREIARFVVPPAHEDNRYAGSSFQFLEAKFAERRTAPEYINIRHRVTDTADPKQIEDLNKRPWKEFVDTVRKGGYEAAHFLDDSCEGCIVATVSGIEMGEANKTNFAAFSMVSAPDFFPLVDQADVTDWVQRVLGRYPSEEIVLIPTCFVQTFRVCRRSQSEMTAPRGLKALQLWLVERAWVEVNIGRPKTFDLLTHQRRSCQTPHRESLTRDGTHRFRAVTRRTFWRPTD
jgi:hypothetical protein